jgi:hypothetical protein
LGTGVSMGVRIRLHPRKDITHMEVYTTISTTVVLETV